MKDMKPNEVIKKIIKQESLNLLTECGCEPAYQRCHDKNLRDDLDKNIAKFSQGISGDDVNILMVGPGNMRQVLTLAAASMQQNKNVNFIIIEPRLFCEMDAEPKINPTLFKQFEIAAAHLKKLYNKNCKIIGKFSSISNYSFFINNNLPDNKKNISGKMRRDILNYAKTFHAKYKTSPWPKGININKHVGAFINIDIDNNRLNLIHPDIICCIDIPAPEKISKTLKEVVHNKYNKHAAYTYTIATNNQEKTYKIVHKIGRARQERPKLI